jgi:hypothetical protein
MLPAITGMIGAHHCAQLLVEKGVLQTICLAGLELHDPPDLSLPSSKDYKCEPLALSFTSHSLHSSSFIYLVIQQILVEYLSSIRYGFRCEEVAVNKIGIHIPCMELPFL